MNVKSYQTESLAGGVHKVTVTLDDGAQLTSTQPINIWNPEPGLTALGTDLINQAIAHALASQAKAG